MFMYSDMDHHAPLWFVLHFFLMLGPKIRGQTPLIYVRSKTSSLGEWSHQGSSRPQLVACGGSQRLWGYSHRAACPMLLLLVFVLLVVTLSNNIQDRAPDTAGCWVGCFWPSMAGPDHVQAVTNTTLQQRNVTVNALHVDCWLINLLHWNISQNLSKEGLRIYILCIESRVNICQHYCKSHLFLGSVSLDQGSRYSMVWLFHLVPMWPDDHAFIQYLTMDFVVCCCRFCP